MPTPLINTGQVQAKGTQRVRKRPRILSVAAMAIIALAAMVFVPAKYRPDLLTDEDVIALERTHRQWRASVGLPLPRAPDTTRLPQRLAESGLKEGVPVLIRIFKREFELELWMKRDGVFQHFTTYPVCRWSGLLGPKLQQGDHQAPEGFYSVDANALNPNSSWYRSFNLGYPNAFDMAHGRTGSLIMVHGGCASVGCFAMTNTLMGEIWQLVTAALQGGQRRFQVQVYPFRMSDAKLQAYANHPAAPFWRNLKLGNDLFEASNQPPRVNVCNGVYGFKPAGVYPDGDGGIEIGCSGPGAKS